MTTLITGASRGIGLELASQLAARGEDVIATARDPGGSPELKRLGVRVEPLDVCDPASAEALARAIEGAPIDVLINNAGVQHHDMSLGRVDVDAMMDVYRTNAIGPLVVTRALLDRIRQSERRLVINISTNLASIAGNRSPKRGGWYAYRASKAALNMLTVNLAHELEADGITCVAIHPGWVRTDMGGPEAPLSAEQSAAGILRVIDGLSPSDTGRFVDYRGEPMPW